MTWDDLEKALGQEPAKERGQGWVRTGFWGRGMGGQGLGDKLGWGMEGRESQPREFPTAECLDVRVLTPEITCWNPG